jgi:two-component system sensor kinase FixL
MPLYRASRLGQETRNMELVMEVEDGRKVPVLVSAAPIRDAAGQIVAAINTWVDISKMKQAEERLRSSEERYRGLFESMQEGLFVAEVIQDEDGNPTDFRFLDVNPVTERQYGIPREKFIGHTYKEVLPGSDKELIDVVGKVGLTGQPTTYERYGRVSGLWFYCTLYSPQPGQVVNVATDITERKRAEEALKDYAGELERANRDLQSFMVVASHDLQEPLRKIEVFGNAVLENTSSLDERQEDYFLRMRKSAVQMRELVNGLFQFTFLTSQRAGFQQVDLHQVALSVVADFSSQLRDLGGLVEVGKLPVIEADPDQMKMLLHNLVENSLKFHRPGVPPEVKIYARNGLQDVTGLGPEGINHPVLLPTVTLLVEDNGIGFDEALAGKIFDPFERLVGKNKPEYGGSGMGLAICRRIAERHGGEINVHSRAGEGTIFEITLQVHPKNRMRETEND